MIDDAVDALVASEDCRKRFLDQAAGVDRLYKAVLPDPLAHELHADCVLIRVLAKKTKALSPVVDTPSVMQPVWSLLDSSIAAEGYTVGEQLTEEQLALFDLLTKREMALTENERPQVKKTARELLATLGWEKVALDWRRRRQGRAQVRLAIGKFLDEGLPPAYTPDLSEAKTAGRIPARLRLLSGRREVRLWGGCVVEIPRVPQSPDGHIAHVTE